MTTQKSKKLPASNERHSVEKMRQQLKSTLSYRVLEGRIAFDAALAATAVEVAADNQEANTPDAGANAEPVQPVSAGDVSALAGSLSNSAPAPGGRSVVFVDGAVNDPARIAAAAPQGAEIVMLDRNRDGVEQIASYLAGKSGFDAIHIVSHGGAGSLQLGSSYLTLKSISGEHADEMSIIGSALSDDADLLIYGCDVSAGEGGRVFVDALAAATGADVAASSDNTGSAAYGANWDLETRLGLIEAGLIDAPEWNGVLAPFSISATTAPVVRDNTGAVVAITAHDANFNTVAVGTAGSTNVHITDPAKMVGATVIWANAGFVGGTAIDLRATVLSVTDTNPNANQPVTLNFAINGDDPSVRIENAEVRIRWEAFAAGTYNPVTGTGTIAQGDVGFFIRDIDARAISMTPAA